MITPAQLRAARGLLDWTRADLAKAANVSPETIKNIEHGTFRPQEGTADAITRAFKAHDVEFTENEGVRKAVDTVTIYEGHDDFKRFMDDLYETARQPSSLKDGNKPICASNVDNNLFKQHLKDYAMVHINRMIEIKNLRISVIAAEKDVHHVPQATYLQYRYEKNQKALSVPFYVYGDKFAIINFNVENAPRIIVINSALVASSYREQFETMWKNLED